MFKQGKSPAYGTGISANLVSKEERQRYNYGGIVGLKYGNNPWEDESFYWHHGTQNKPGTGIAPTRMKDWYEKIPTTWWGTPVEEGGKPIGNLGTWEKIYGEESPHGKKPVYDNLEGTQGFSEVDDTYLSVGTGEDKDIVERSIDREIQPDANLLKQAKDAGFDDIESWQAAISDTEDMEGPFSKRQIKKARRIVDEQFADQDKAKALTGEGTGAGTGVVDDTTMLDMDELISKYYDKDKTLGEAQLGLAGQVLKAGFQPKKEAMGTLGDAMGAFGKTAAADEKAMKKLAMTGEIQRELYKTSRSQEGKEDRKTAEFKNKLPKKENEAWTTADRFDIAQAGSMKAGITGDNALWREVDFALPGTQVLQLTGGTDKTSLEKDAAKIAAGDEDTLYIKDGIIWAKDESGKLTVRIDFEDIGLVKPQK